ncbi:hypothetical protein O6P43_014212 [Quillaja saponaria]|uniref:Uncharacterized protein n=1 Tax=Quillaja saponaria TaxID=32244 RepID=A0AAD7LU71_QUISA|nr:hypothetical protein O6P43_014212 [Quillaja saponaria]
MPENCSSSVCSNTVLETSRSRRLCFNCYNVQMKKIKASSFTNYSPLCIPKIICYTWFILKFHHKNKQNNFKI